MRGPTSWRSIFMGVLPFLPKGVLAGISADGNLEPPKDLLLCNHQGGFSHGLVFVRYRHVRRAVRAHAAGHLLRRAPDRKVAARYDREGVGCRAQEGLPDASQADQGPD